jgi:hypothetical protein
MIIITWIAGAFAFFTSPVGRLVGVGMIVMAAYGYGYYQGDKHGDKQCADAALRNKILRQKIEINIAKDQAANAKSTAAELERLNQEAEVTISALQKQLKERPEIVRDANCRVPAGGVRDKPRPKR